MIGGEVRRSMCAWATVCGENLYFIGRSLKLPALATVTEDDFTAPSDVMPVNFQCHNVINQQYSSQLVFFSVDGL